MKNNPIFLFLIFCISLVSTGNSQEYYNDDDPWYLETQQNKYLRMKITGIALSSVGTLAAGAGAALLSTVDSIDFSNHSDYRGSAGIAMLGVGVVSLGTGITFIIIGHKKATLIKQKLNRNPLSFLWYNNRCYLKIAIDF